MELTLEYAQILKSKPIEEQITTLIDILLITEINDEVKPFFKEFKPLLFKIKEANKLFSTSREIDVESIKNYILSKNVEINRQA
jgi:hypothetical protein